MTTDTVDMNGVRPSNVLLPAIYGDGDGERSRAQSPLRATPAYLPTKRLHVVTIGAGYSGLTLAHKLQHQHPEMQDIVDHTIFEAREEIGGTWLVNRYPGVVCDVPSHIYAFPFDPNPNWTHFYSSGPEIWKYMRKTVDKWHLDRDVKLNHRVVGAYWQEKLGQWEVKVEHNGVEFAVMADILISGQGFLNTWKWPDITGLCSFKGEVVHSAQWPSDHDYSGKRIGLIGNGSSGIQILPQLSKLPGTKVISFQRAPTWVVSTMNPASLLGKEDDGIYNPTYTDEDKNHFRENQAAHNKYRKTLIHNINDGFKMFVKGSPENAAVFELAKTQMSEKLQNDPKLCEKLIPSWELGCRRITPGEGYLESFLLPNVHLNQSAINKVTESGIWTADGKFHELDVIACATGFDVSYKPQYPVIGRNGVDLREKWADEPVSYMSLGCPDMPNYFMFTGPNAVIGHGSLMEGLGWSAEYMIKWVKKIAEEDIKSIAPRQEVVDEFNTYADQIHDTLVWTGGCRSWYKNNTVDGRVTATFGGSALLYKRLIGELRAEDFNIEYRSSNRFRFMGTGFLECEQQEGVDLAWYVEK